MFSHIPDWVKNAVFYQIFPDRFARSPRTRHPRGIRFQPWGTPPEEQGFQGGDLHGIVDQLPYLAELGITALYLNPIFCSAANHRYHTFDYLRVDPLLGGDGALRELLDAAHERGMRVVLDGVFNHASRGFWPFHHILEEGGNSPYIDWFTVRDWPLRPYNHDAEHPHNYASWWNLAALPKFNFDNPGVQEYLLHVARYWVDFGIDGWRLDVPEEIDNLNFWRSFRRLVKESNPDAYLCGEIWHDATVWLQGDRFDAVMNYVFSRAAMGFCAAQSLRPDYRPGGYAVLPLSAAEFGHQITHMLGLYDWEVTQAQLNLLDSHDTARVRWIVGGDRSAQQLCVLLQMTMPGAPCIYYGDEIGLSGADDPACRAAFPWHDEAQWDQELLAFYRRVVALRHGYPVLRTGGFIELYAQDGIYAYARLLPDQEAVVVLNTNSRAAHLDLRIARPELFHTRFSAAWNGRETTRVGDLLPGLLVPARDGLVLVSRPDQAPRL